MIIIHNFHRMIIKSDSQKITIIPDFQKMIVISELQRIIITSTTPGQVAPPSPNSWLTGTQSWKIWNQEKAAIQFTWISVRHMINVKQE